MSYAIADAMLRGERESEPGVEGPVHLQDGGLSGCQVSDRDNSNTSTSVQVMIARVCNVSV